MIPTSRSLYHLKVAMPPIPTRIVRIVWLHWEKVDLSKSLLGQGIYAKIDKAYDHRRNHLQIRYMCIINFVFVNTLLIFCLFQILDQGTVEVQISYFRMIPQLVQKQNQSLVLEEVLTIQVRDPEKTQISEFSISIVVLMG